MASTISAGTTSGTAIAITGDTTGNLAFTTQAGTYTQTLPNATGTVMVSGNMPAFCAYRSASTQSISQNTWTKVQFQTKEFDTSSAYDNATNYRFTPLVAGYYQVNLSIGLSFNTTAPSTIYISLYKNGSSYRTGQIISSNPYGTIALSDVVYFNGSTDYIEGYGYSNSASAVVLYQTNNIAAPFCTFFSASLVRTA